MNDVLNNLYETIRERRQKAEPNSYTSYLFDKGLDKILKKCGEECAEMIIAAKNGESSELASEISDLLYHVIVLCVECGIEWHDIEDVLRTRGKKAGNLKQFHNTENDML